MLRTKIICTLVPSVDNKDMIKQLMLGGMNVARINFSHGNYEEHEKRVKDFKEVRDDLGLPIPLLLDTKGPEIRLGLFKTREVILEEGKEFILTFENLIGDDTKSTITYKNLYKDVEKGSKIFINDGLVELKVENINDKDIYCRVQNGGVIGNNKSINVPNSSICLPALTEKDISDILFGIEHEFDFIAGSFIRKASDVIEIRKVLEQNNGQDIKVISKIENREGINNFDAILKVSDGIMVARGDLGVEVSVEQVPIIQRELIEKCVRNGKPVITATQMLDSMIRNPRPTRAEANDISNAIYEGTSALMLSGETASGKYPIESLLTMKRIAKTTENAIDFDMRFQKSTYESLSTVTNAISHATCTTALDLKAAAIMTVTHSGNTARMISRFRPSCPIIAATVSERSRRQLSLSWGVLAYVIDEVDSTDEMFELAIDKGVSEGVLKNGDLIIITGGMPVKVSGTTNILKVHIVGNVLVQGKGYGGKTVTGEITIARTIEEATENFSDGNILVVPFTSDEFIPVLKRAKAVICEADGDKQHAITISKALDIPVIVGAENAVKILKNGSVVTVNASEGNVYFEDHH